MSPQVAMMSTATKSAVCRSTGVSAPSAVASPVAACTDRLLPTCLSGSFSRRRASRPDGRGDDQREPQDEAADHNPERDVLIDLELLVDIEGHHLAHDPEADRKQIGRAHV